MSAAGREEQAPDPENLRTEYNVIADYVTSLTGQRFQTLAIYLAAMGLLVGLRRPAHLTAVFMLVASLGLWTLELRNRDVLWRLGERGKEIERAWSGSTEERGFFLQRDEKPRVRLLLMATPKVSLSKRWPTHAFAIDLVFLGAIGYAIAILCGVDNW